MAKPELQPRTADQIKEAYTVMRARMIREARARNPAPSYQQIALECGCSMATVYRVLTGQVHRGPGV